MNLRFPQDMKPFVTHLECANCGNIERYMDTQRAWAVAFSPDGRLLALGGFEPDIVLCYVRPGGEERPLSIPIARTTAVAFSPHGRTLAATGESINEIILWDLSSGQVWDVAEHVKTGHESRSSRVGDGSSRAKVGAALRPASGASL